MRVTRTASDAWRGWDPGQDAACTIPAGATVDVSDELGSRLLRQFAGEFRSAEPEPVPVPVARPEPEPAVRQSEHNTMAPEPAKKRGGWPKGRPRKVKTVGDPAGE